MTLEDDIKKFVNMKPASKPVEFKIGPLDHITRDFDGGVARLRYGRDLIPIKVGMENGMTVVWARDDVHKIVKWCHTGSIVPSTTQHPLDIVSASKKFVMASGSWELNVGTKTIGHLFLVGSVWKVSYVKDATLCSCDVDEDGRFIDGHLIRKL